MFRRHGSGRTPESHALAGDRGAVTVEAAITFGTLVAVAGLLAGGIAATVDHLRCVDAAGEAARLWARGDETHAHEAVGRIAPAGATLTVDDDGTGIAVRVDAPAAGGMLPGIDVSADAYAVPEPGLEGEVNADAGAERAERNDSADRAGRADRAEAATGR